MANNKKTTSKILRVSDLPNISKIWDGMYTIIAYNKQNYLLDVSKIKGKKIFDITANQSDEPGGKNIIYIKFTDGTTASFAVYNGTNGEIGRTGAAGLKGKQGAPAAISQADMQKYGITGILYIINNCDTEDPNLPWSAYRGKVMNDELYKLNETFITEDEFDILFNNVKYIYAEFKTKQDDKLVKIFNNDTNNHIIYKKYWTYEDEGLDTYYVYNPNSNVYDVVSVDLWKDIYLGATEGFFLATGTMLKDSTVLYYLDKETNNYLLVEKIWKYVNQEDEEGNIVTVEKYLGDKHISNYYIPEIDTSISGDYSIQTDKWTFEINAKSELVKDIYVLNESEESEEQYRKLTDSEVNAIDPNIYGEYYQKTKEGRYIKIYNIGNYLSTNEDIRYYKKVNKSDNLYTEVKEENISREDFDDYLIVSRDSLTNVYTFERHYAELIYDEMVYFTTTVSLNNIDLYYYTQSRDYYTLNIKENISKNDLGEDVITYEQIYTKIEIPSWIYAEFKTEDEDQLSLIINANEGLGEEDNTEIDETEEDLNSYVREKNIIRIVPGDKKPLYHKNSDNTYTLVNLNIDNIYPNAQYYILDDEYIYEEISGEDADYDMELYIKQNNIYIPYNNLIVANDTYYIRKENYIKVNNPEEYLSTYNLVLFYGEPKLLPITIYPFDQYRSYVSIEYDPEKIRLYENGRIAAVTDNNFDTQVIVRAQHNPNIYCTINIRVTTPAKQIVFNESNEYNVDIKTETNTPERIIKYQVLPENTFDKQIDWVVSDNEAITIEQIDETSIKIIGNKKIKNCKVTANAHDTYGATNSFNFEVIQPPKSIEWITDTEENKTGIIFNNTVYYNQDECDEFNYLHYDEIENGTIERITTETVKTNAYYSLKTLLGKEYMLSIKILPEDTSYPEITWREDNGSVAYVIEKNIEIIDQEEENRIASENDVQEGIALEVGQNIHIPKKSHMELRYFVKAVGIGNTNITGKLTKYPDLEINLTVIVNQSIESITIHPDTLLSFNVNTKKRLTAEIKPESLVTEENRTSLIKWISSDTNILTVSPQGTVTTLNPGTTTVIAKALDGSDKEGICTIKVTIPTKDIILSGETLNGIIYVGIGKSTKITADIIHSTEYGTNESNMIKEINWVSTNTDIATINNDGTVTGIALGKTTIIANAKDGSGVFGTIQVQVIKLVENISFEFNEITMELGDSLVLIPNITPVDASNEIVKWKSSDETIAKVKESGIVYALSSGTATITATTTDNTNLTATCNITIL